MLCYLYCWEVVAFAVFVILWFIARSCLKIDGINHRHVFITGCDTGFGRLLAESLDAKGVHVFAGCLSEKHAEDLKGRSSSRLKTVQIDVTDCKSVRRAAEYVKVELGDKALWAVVNNAGISGVSVPFEWSTKEDCRNVLDVNLLGVYDVTLAFLPLIKRGKEGRIVNISSIFGRVAFIIGGYPMSKYGIEAFSDGLGFEMKPYNITVHTLNPGWFRTSRNIEMIDGSTRKRFLELDENLKEQYGGERYMEDLIAFSKNFLDKCLSSKLHLVVEAYEHALFAKYPQNRYTVGMDAKLFYIPLSWLHFDLQVMILNFMQRITGNQAPVPRDAVVR